MGPVSSLFVSLTRPAARRYDPHGTSNRWAFVNALKPASLPSIGQAKPG